MIGQYDKQPCLLQK